jgi:hypothetical protein
VITAAEFNWRQIAINIVASGFEIRVNRASNASRTSPSSACGTR